MRHVTKHTKPPVNVGPKRWAKYVARNLPLVKRVKHPERYLHSSRTVTP